MASPTADLAPVLGNPSGPIAVALETIRRGVSLLVEPGAVHEVRILHTRSGTVSGYFDSADTLAEAVEAWDGKAPAIYVMLNPVKPDLLARAANRLELYAKHTTSNQDILRRRWFALDFDPVRPSGISSTDTEHEAALARAQQVRDWLAGGGWPDPVLIDSGNGAHLLYRIDLPNTPDSLRLIERCLGSLAFQFSDDVVVLDLKVGNPARIWKVPGTMACKGDSLPERPHRRSRILEAPTSFVLVPLDLLEGLAASAPKAEDNGHGPSGTGRSFDLDGWLASHPLSIVSSGSWNNGRKWILNPCPWNPEHTNGAAYIVQFASGAIAAGCHHNGCHGKSWHELRDVVEPGWRTARGEPPQEQAERAGLFTSGLSTLLSVGDEPIPWLAHGLLVGGANGFIGGEPKSLKSWLALYLALCLSNGTAIFGRYTVPQRARVLYIQEEDGARRVRWRTRRLLKALGVEPPDDAFFRYSIKAGLLLDDKAWVARLRAELADYRPAIVIGDVFELMHSQDSDRRKELKPVFYDLDRLREEFGCGFLLADHFKKASIGTSKRGGQRLAGTVGKHAWGENSLYLFPAPGKNRVRVETELKDGPSEVFGLSLEDTPEGGVAFKWEAEAQDRSGEMKAKMLEAVGGLAPLGEWVTAAQAGEAAGVTRNTARKYLDLLVDEGQKLEREQRQAGKVRAWYYRLTALRA